MSDHLALDQDLEAAAAAYAARTQILAAVAELATSPLDKQAAARMRAALEVADSEQVRAAIGRLAATPPVPGGRNRHLRPVTGAGDARTPRAPQAASHNRLTPGGIA